MTQLKLVTQYQAQSIRSLHHRARPSMNSGQRYAAALCLVADIDEDLTRGTRHYRTRAGALLTTLDQVVQAILTDDLMTEDEPVLLAA